MNCDREPKTGPAKVQRLFQYFLPRHRRQILFPGRVWTSDAPGVFCFLGTNPLSILALSVSLRSPACSPFCRLTATSSPGRGKSFKGRALGKSGKSCAHRSTPCTRQPITNKLPASAKASPPRARWHFAQQNDGEGSHTKKHPHPSGCGCSDPVLIDPIYLLLFSISHPAVRQVSRSPRPCPGRSGAGSGSR